MTCDYSYPLVLTLVILALWLPVAVLLGLALQRAWGWLLNVWLD